ncbi:hypothetical protein ANN_06159 [Periplaneta americana]|uniref:Transposase n=1 Tax=Periplaneta americana TaxID=6978 RepID=A0ABQ8TEM6_PERAM|nr:hypothetical protein ANN_06159 [Periplaneta americana]
MVGLCEGGNEPPGSLKANNDECLFFLDGHVHTQNARYWSKENSRWLREAGAPKVMVWCEIHCDMVVGPYFFGGNVNQRTYGELLDSTVMEFLYDLPLDKRIRMWFLQDGATAHYALTVRQKLN